MRQTNFHVIKATLCNGVTCRREWWYFILNPHAHDSNCSNLYWSFLELFGGVLSSNISADCCWCVHDHVPDIGTAPPAQLLHTSFLNCCRTRNSKAKKESGMDWKVGISQKNKIRTIWLEYEMYSSRITAYRLGKNHLRQHGCQQTRWGACPFRIPYPLILLPSPSCPFLPVFLCVYAFQSDLECVL